VTRLKLRDDAYYVPTGEGVCIFTNSGKAVLTGPSIFQWVDRLAPYLDGRYTLAELTASMPPDRGEMTERVVTALRDQRVVVEAGEAEEASLTDAERHTYRREIGFLGYFGPSAERSFHAYRESVVVLLGSGRVLVETVEAALCSGSRSLRLGATGDGVTDGGITDGGAIDVALLAECERRSRQRDPDQRITRVAVDLADEERLSEVVAGSGLVVYAAAGAAVDEVRTVDGVRTLDRACARAGIPFVAAILTGEEAWLGPFGLTAGQLPGWMSAWRRLLALAGSGAGRPRRADAGPDDLAGSAPTVVANQLVREAVRLLSGTVEQAGQARMTRVDLRSLATQRHGFLPHPFSLPVPRPDQASPRASLQATVRRLRDGEPVSPEELSRRVVACLQTRIGVLGEVTEQDFTQIPLAVSQVQVSDPVLLLGPDVPLPVATGAGLSLADARRAAVLHGLVTYGTLMVDPRRLHTRPDTAAQPGTADPRTGDPEEDLRALRAGRWSGFVWGQGLADELPHELPATVAFPALRDVGPTYAPPAGAAAGYDWAEAVRGGLVSQCRRLTLAEVAECRRPFTPVDWDEIALDGSGDRYRSMARIIGERLDVYDVTGSPGVPTLAFCLGGTTVAYASGLSFAVALRDGLAEVLLSHQARGDHEAGYGPAPVPPLPPRGRLSRVVTCPEWSTDEATTLARLARLGWVVVAVPLDHDPGVAAILPYLVNVVLTRA